MISFTRVFRITLRLILAFVLFSASSVTSRAADIQMTRGINIWPLFGYVCRTKDAEKYCQKLFPPLDAVGLTKKFVRLREVGFDFVRVPIDASPFMDLGEKADRWIDRLVAFASLLEDLGLAVLIDYHSGAPGYKYEEIASSDELMAKLETFYVKLAIKLREGRHDKVVIEVMNEPNSTCNDPLWDRRRSELHAAIRRAVKDVPIMVGGACWNDIDSMIRIAPAEFDQNTYYTFHYYRPQFFTHQGATWQSHFGIRTLTGVPWPASAGSLEQTIAAIDANLLNNPTYKKVGQLAHDQAIDLAKKYFAESPGASNIGADFDTVTKWADRHGVPRSHVVLGEFGVLKWERHYFGADMPSTARWLTAVRTAAEERRLPWAMWNYTKGMALTLTDESDDLNPAILEALGLQQPADQVSKR